MPRPKMINTNNIRLEKINAEVIEKKSCLGVELIFDTAFTTGQINDLVGFYKFQVSNNGHTLSRSVQNSWKGLVTMLVSVAYCRYRDKLLAQIKKCNDEKKIKPRWNLLVHFDYSYFLGIYHSSELHDLQLEAIPMIPNDKEAIGQFFQDRETYRAKLNIGGEQKLKDLLSKRSPDQMFQNVPAPKTWKPCYMSAGYRPKDIEIHLKMFANLLNIDRKNSIITTNFASQIPQKYKDYPAKYLG